MITDEKGHEVEKLPDVISKKCGCKFALIDEQPIWHQICNAHQTALSLQTRIIRRNIAQQVLDQP